MYLYCAAVINLDSECDAESLLANHQMCKWSCKSMTQIRQQESEGTPDRGMETQEE